MSEYTIEEATLDIERDYYDELAVSTNVFAPYVSYIMERYYDDQIVEWEKCKKVLTYVLNNEISGDKKLEYLVNFHEYNDYKEEM